MSFYHPDRSLPRRFGLVQASFLQIEGLPFAEVLSEDEIQQAFADEGVDFAQEEDEIYTPPLTLWAFLSQVLHKGEQRSCVAAVSRVLVLLVAPGREPCSKNTGAYCRTRAKLPEKTRRPARPRCSEKCSINSHRVTFCWRIAATAASS